jgi:chromatin segregation and condensation protein Rec8/ScpA/Scc1 (kleisin family)
MDEFAKLLKQLNQTRRDLQSKLDRVHIAIASLQKGRPKQKREIPDSARNKMRLAQRRRWVKWHREHKGKK